MLLILIWVAVYVLLGDFFWVCGFRDLCLLIFWCLRRLDFLGFRFLVLIVWVLWLLGFVGFCATLIDLVLDWMVCAAYGFNVVNYRLHCCGMFCGVDGFGLLRWVLTILFC